MSLWCLMKKWINNKRDWCKRKEDLLIIAVIGVALFVYILCNSDYLFDIYAAQNLNESILNFSGTLFGLMLTAYAVLFGLIPALSKEILEMDALQSVNFRFMAATIISVLLAAISFLIFFAQGTIKALLVYVQMALLMSIMLLVPLLVCYLYFLFKDAKKKP